MGYKSSHIGLSAACISCTRLLAAQTYTTVRRKQLLKLFRKIAAETMRLSRYLGMWGTRGVGSQVSHTHVPSISFSICDCRKSKINHGRKHLLALKSSL